MAQARSVVSTIHSPGYRRPDHNTYRKGTGAVGRSECSLTVMSSSQNGSCGFCVCPFARGCALLLLSLSVQSEETAHNVINPAISIPTTANSIYCSPSV